MKDNLLMNYVHMCNGSSENLKSPEDGSPDSNACRSGGQIRSQILHSPCQLNMELHLRFYLFLVRNLKQQGRH